MEGTPKTSPTSRVGRAVMESNSDTTSTGDALQRFLQRTRNDRMFELRNLQHGVRPVTGQCHRQTLEAFMNKQVKMEEGPQGNKQNVPANRDEVEEHRPDAVVVEVQGLFQQQRVSSMLQSAEFRRHLEQIISNSVSGSSQNRTFLSHRRTPPPPLQSSSDSGIRTQAGQRPERNHSPSEENVASLESSSSTTTATTTSSSTTSNSVPVVEDGPVHSGGVSNEGVALSWQQINAVHQEQIVQEISELLHQQLVSSTLNGQFRGTLELQMQNQLSRSAANGAAVESMIRSLPPSGVLRNDFSHMGLHPPQDDADNISVTSFSATAVPYTHSNLHLSREIQQVKVQLAEMTRMLRLSFDLQMDIQRSIRQEVAAALTSRDGAYGGRTVDEALATSRSRPLQDDKCLICLDRRTDCLLYQCGHLCLCFQCGRDLQVRGSHCPVCRAQIRDVVRAYRCNQD